MIHCWAASGAPTMRIQCCGCCGMVPVHFVTFCHPAWFRTNIPSQVAWGTHSLRFNTLHKQNMGHSCVILIMGMHRQGCACCAHRIVTTVVLWCVGNIFASSLIGRRQSGLLMSAFCLVFHVVGYAGLTVHSKRACKRAPS